MSWLDLNDRLVVTWQGMRTYDPSGTNSYQVELFHNGNVRMTCGRTPHPPKPAKPLREVEAVEVHHLRPRGDEVLHELLLPVGAAIDFRQRAKQ